MAKDNSRFVPAGLVPGRTGSQGGWLPEAIPDGTGKSKKKPAAEKPGSPPKPADSTPLSIDEIRSTAFNEGKAAGLRQAEDQFGAAANALAAALEDINQLRESILAKSSPDMLKLVMAIAEQVIHCEVACNEDVILNTLKNSLQAAIKSDEFFVKIHPDDFAMVSENKQKFIAAISGLQNIHFEADPAITRGGCLVESTLGKVDATIDAQLEEIRQHLLNSIEKG